MYPDTHLVNSMHDQCQKVSLHASRELLEATCICEIDNLYSPRISATTSGCVYRLDWVDLTSPLLQLVVAEILGEYKVYICTKLPSIKYAVRFRHIYNKSLLFHGHACTCRWLHAGYKSMCVLKHILLGLISILQSQDSTPVVLQCTCTVTYTHVVNSRINKISASVGNYCGTVGNKRFGKTLVVNNFCEFGEHINFSSKQRVEMVG